MDTPLPSAHPVLAALSIPLLYGILETSAIPDITGISSSVRDLGVMGLLMLIVKVLHSANEKLQTKVDDVTARSHQAILSLIADHSKATAILTSEHTKTVASIMADYSKINSERSAEIAKLMTKVMETVKENHKVMDEIGTALDNNSGQIEALSTIIEEKLGPRTIPS